MKPQKAKHLHLEADKKRPAFVGHDYMMFEKHDGWYGYADLPGCVIMSGAMREIPSLQELSAKLREVKPDITGRLIFEIMIEGLEIDSFPTLNGILNRKNEQVEDVYLRVHDFLPRFECNVPFSKRYDFATAVVERMDIPEVRMSPVLGKSDEPAVWQETAEQVWKRNAEGVILKREGGFYTPEKRNFDLMKIKEELSLDLEVVSMVEGQGKYTGTLGALCVRDRAGNIHEVSGMTDSQREHWWKHPASIVGKVVEVKAMKRLPNGSLREPRFKAVRFDKCVEEID